jgi:allantoicase
LKKYFLNRNPIEIKVKEIHFKGNYPKFVCQRNNT